MNLSSEIKAGQTVEAKSSMANAQGSHIGTVDRLDGSFIKLKKTDSPDGKHHWLPLSLVDQVVDGAIQLNKDQAQVQKEILSSNPSLM